MDYQIIYVEQGSDEWHKLRKTKITATDASVIMGVSKWKTPLQLWKYKTSDTPPEEPSEAAKRGIRLEPIVRDLYSQKTGYSYQPIVVSNQWQMASLDGYSPDNREIIEIKCPNKDDHNLAKKGLIPDHYWPQVQHQMLIMGLEMLTYLSYDEKTLEIVHVKKDQEFCRVMWEKELEFLYFVREKIPPKRTYKDITERKDSDFMFAVAFWERANNDLKFAKELEEQARAELIEACKEESCEGFGVKCSQVERQGNVDYASIPELKNVDLEKYRKPATMYWKIS